VVNRIEEAADVSIEHPPHALAHDRRVKRRPQRIKSEAIWEDEIPQPAKDGLNDEDVDPSARHQQWLREDGHGKRRGHDGRG
jgi:hypothetical protein